VLEIQILGGLLVVGLLLWSLIAWAGAMGVMTLHKARLKPLSEEAVRKILRRVLRQAPEVNAEWLKSEGFPALGVYRAEGLIGNPRIIVWQNRGEATWFCGYLLPDGQIQLDLVSEMGDSALTTGTSKDGHLFPTAEGKYIQTFDIDDMSDLWELNKSLYCCIVNLSLRWLCFWQLKHRQ